ncbi:MAG: hypothetical protein ACT4QD_00140 [Acidobacteriota bacterium]
MIDFTFDSYRALLDHIRACGHAICPLGEVPAAGGYVILRHDVDYSVAKALEMAEVEHARGVRATVCLMLASPYYNLLDPENLQAALRIAALGHEIGFHYDTDALHGIEAERRGEAIVRQARFLAATLGVEVRSVAQHNPSVTPTRVRVPGLIDAYDDRFVKEIAYLSDSRRLFGTPDVFRFFEEHERSQLLIHPLWWHAGSLSRREAFQAVRAGVLSRVEHRLDAMAQSMEADERRRRAR